MSHRRRNRIPQGGPTVLPVSDTYRKWASGGNLVDVLMPVYGEWILAEKAYASIAPAFQGVGEPYRVVVVDNGTPDFTDPSGQVIAAAQQAQGFRALMRPQDIFIRLDKNIGYGGALNVAASKGAAPLILVYTADVVMDPASLQHVVKDMDEPGIGVVGVKLVFPTGESPHGPPGKVQHAGIAFNIRGDPFHVFISWSPDNPRVNRRREMAAVTGALFITRRSLWNAYRGMDPIFGAGTYEDMDYCFKVREGGSRILFDPAAVGTHFVGGSIVKGAGKQGFNLMMNSMAFKSRWQQRLLWDEFRYW